MASDVYEELRQLQLREVVHQMREAGWAPSLIASSFGITEAEVSEAEKAGLPPLPTWEDFETNDG
jgi:transcriptional regulator